MQRNVKAVKNETLIALVVAFALSFCLLIFSGCAQTFAIGTDSSDAVKISAKNETGQAITAVATKVSSAESFGDPLEQQSDWANDVSAELYLVQVSVEATAQETTETPNATVTAQEDLIVEPRTDIQITTADGMTYDLHQLNLEDIKDATFKIENGTAYLVYTSIASGEEVNTLDAELAYQEQVKAAAQAQQQDDPDASVKAASSADDQSSSASGTKSSSNKSTSSGSGSSSSSGSSSGSSGSSSSGSSSGSSGSASSGEDVCVDDLVLN